MSVEDRPRRVWLWWAYFWLTLAAAIPSSFGLLEGTFFDVLILVLTVLQFVSLVGYIKQIRIWTRNIWVSFFLLWFLSFLINSVGFELPAVSAADAVQIAILFALTIPMVWANFAYAFLSSHLWATPAKGAVRLGR